MVAVEIYAAVRRFVFIEGKSRREAARVFGLSRDTIAKMCRYSAPPGYVRSKAPERPKLGPLVPVIDAILEADKTAPPKQRHTAKRIFERLRLEHGCSMLDHSGFAAMAPFPERPLSVIPRPLPREVHPSSCEFGGPVSQRRRGAKRAAHRQDGMRERSGNIRSAGRRWDARARPADRRRSDLRKPDIADITCLHRFGDGCSDRVLDRHVRIDPCNRRIGDIFWTSVLLLRAMMACH